MQPTISIPELAALAHGLSHSNSTCRRSCWPYRQHLMPRRGGLQDHLCRFTPPLILYTLDVFPSNQGKFRVSPNLGNHFKCIKSIFEPLTCRCCIGSALAHHLKARRPTTPYYHEAQCSLPFAFHSVPHSRAAFATQVRRVSNISSHPCEVTRRAEACATASDHLRLPTQQGSM